MILLFTSFFTIVTFHSEERRTIGNLKKWNRQPWHWQSPSLPSRCCFSKARPKGAWRRGRQGGGAGKNSFTPFSLPHFYTSTSPLESILDSPRLSVSRKSISIAQQNTPALRANTAPLGVHWFVDCSFVLNGHLRSLVTYRTLYALYLPLGVCVYFEVNSTLTAYPHRTLHPRPHNRNSFCQLLIFQLLLGDVRGTQRLFSVNICSEKQILPRICYYLRTAKNF